MNKITWVKPYARIEYNGYAAPHAVVAFGRRVVGWKSEDMGNGMGRMVEDQVMYQIQINLWLVILNFTWNKHVKNS